MDVENVAKFPAAALLHVFVLFHFLNQRTSNKPVKTRETIRKSNIADSLPVSARLLKLYGSSDFGFLMSAAY